MSNPFSVLSVSYGEDESTDNPQRKLAKMKRKYKEKPTPELKSRIEGMDKRLNSKPKKKKKKKKKDDDLDLEEEYQKNKRYWEQYRKKQQEEKERREQQEKEERKRREQQQKEWKKQQEKWEEEQWNRERERQSSLSSFNVSTEQKKTLPQDIQDFISKPPDKKTFNKLCLIYHPDKGGDEEMFKIINNYMN